MNVITDPSRAKSDVRFRAEICWLGPLMIPPCTRNGRREVVLAGAEDPALGKSFGYALQPVITKGKHFAPTSTRWRLGAVTSDRHGWFSIVTPTDLWEGDAEGVLVILLYNESRDLEYYTYSDYHPATDDVDSLPLSRAPRGVQRYLPPMPPEIIAIIEGAIDAAIRRLLDDRDAKTLRPGLALLARPPLAAVDCTSDATLQDEPLAQDAELVFALASCQYPSVMLEDAVAGASYARLAERLDDGSRARPQCLLLLGDQIYVDGTAGLFDPSSLFDRFVRPYEILLRMDPVRDVLRRLPVFMMLDDHEIIDNWEPRADDVRPDPVMIEGRRSYLKFQRRQGPPVPSRRGDSRHPLWYPFRVNGFPLFMADTRTERTSRTARTVDTARIMTVGQMGTLTTWLGTQPADVPKIVASPSILLPRHARALQRGAAVCALRSDGWDGYPESLRSLLAFIACRRIPNVVFVSGDEHLACVARVELETRGHAPVVVHSVHSSPLFAPFPFANSEPADLVADDDFLLDSDVPGCGRLCCHVRTEFGPPGDGFGVLRFYRDGGGWTMECEFDRARGTATVSRRLA
jgi:hypothetical protein